MIINPKFVWGLYRDDEDESDVHEINNTNHGNRKNKPDWLNVIFIIDILLISSIIIKLPWFQKSAWEQDCERIQKQGTKQILDDAHSRAVNSVDTIDIADYQIVSSRRARRDSTRCAKKVGKFIKNTGDKYIVWKKQHFVNGYELVIDKDAMIKESELRKLINDYEHAVQQLAVYRSDFRQK